jgi:hypothetical protein
MKLVLAATLVGGLATGAAAQGTPAANPNAPTNPAVNTQSGNNPGAPAPGANSFTEGQAKGRIEASGFTNVSGLAKDKDGIWRGKAMKGGKSQDIAVDYQGNVVAK